uniref:Uncharacterized protein n=1 Tax=Anguilla anguilla TaxID=7936 RepID=A0A0E9R7E8_ANGAN
MLRCVTKRRTFSASFSATGCGTARGSVQNVDKTASAVKCSGIPWLCFVCFSVFS